MHSGKLVFSQVMGHRPLHVFHHCVDRYNGNFKVKEFTRIDQSYHGIRTVDLLQEFMGIEARLRAQKSKLYHMGIRSSVPRNNLTNANKVRDLLIYADLAHPLIQTIRKFYLDDSFGLELERI